MRGGFGLSLGCEHGSVRHPRAHVGQGKPYTRSVYESTYEWMESLYLFPADQKGHPDYDNAVLV